MRKNSCVARNLPFKMNAKRRISNRRLREYLEELTAIARSITPDVTTRVQIPGHDGQDAWLEIYVPDELEEKIDELVIEHLAKIFMESGCDIGAIVYENSGLAEDASASYART